MNSLSVRLDIPRDLLGALDVPERELELRIKELIALELFREGRISSGKGAELIGVSKHAFIQLLARHDIPYFTQSPEELRDEVEALDHLLKSDHA
jgi:predicted HTH domain antitoxin